MTKIGSHTFIGLSTSEAFKWGGGVGVVCCNFVGHFGDCILPGRLEKMLLLHVRKNVAGCSASIFVILGLDLTADLAPEKNQCCY